MKLRNCDRVNGRFLWKTTRPKYSSNVIFPSSWVSKTRRCRSSISVHCRLKYFAARLRARWSHPLVSRTPPTSRNKQVISEVFFIASSSADRIIAATRFVGLPVGPQRRRGAASLAPYSLPPDVQRVPSRDGRSRLMRQPAVARTSFLPALERRR